MNIYITRYGETYGPYTEKTVRKYVTEGTLSYEDLAWAEGLNGWVELKQVPAIVNNVDSSGKMDSPSPQTDQQASLDVENITVGAESLSPPEAGCLTDGLSQSRNRGDFSDLCVKLIEWMKRNNYILGVDGAQASLQKKKATSIGKMIIGAIGLFTKVPVSVAIAPNLSSLSGSDEDFSRAIEELEPLCNVLGVRPLDGRVLAIINADHLSPDDILQKWQEIDSHSVSFHDLLPMVSSTNRMNCFVCPIQVYSRRELFDNAMNEIYSKGWWRTKFSFKEAWRADAVSTRFHQAGFVDIERKVIKYSRPVGIVGSMQRAMVPLEKAFIKIDQKVFKREFAAFPREDDIF